MSLFSENLLTKVHASAAGGESVLAMIEHIVTELRSQDPATGPVTKTGDVAADLDANKEEIAAAVMAGAPAVDPQPTLSPPEGEGTEPIGEAVDPSEAPVAAEAASGKDPAT